MNSGDNILLTSLLLQSISEEYDIDEGKLKDFLKKKVGPAAIGTVAALSPISTGKTTKHVSPRSDISVTSPVKKEFTDLPSHKEILLRQAYKESGFDPEAKSKKGAKGIAQIMKSTFTDFLKSKKIDSSKINLDDPKHSAEVQKWTMRNLYNSSFINVPNQSEEVRLAKTLAAYNWGRGNLSSFLNKTKERGLDIYNSLDWIKNLPTETYDYINKILLKKDKTFEEKYKEAIDKNPEIKDYYQDQKGFNESKKHTHKTSL